MNNITGAPNWLPEVKGNKGKYKVEEKALREDSKEITKEMKKIQADVIKLQENVLSLYDKANIKELYDMLIVVEHAVNISQRLN